MRLSDDLELEEDELEFLKIAFSKNFQSAEILGLYHSGYLTKREVQEQLFNLTNDWYSRFRSKFGFIPIYVRKLEENKNQWDQEKIL